MFEMTNSERLVAALGSQRCLRLWRVESQLTSNHFTDPTFDIDLPVQQIPWYPE